MKINYLQLIFLVLVSTTSTTVYGQRDPFLWPFEKESIWNMPIHNNAQYYEIPDNDLRPHGRYGIDDNHIILEIPTDPIINVIRNTSWGPGRCNGTNVLYTMRFPHNYVVPDASAGNTPNNNYAFVRLNNNLFTGNVLARCEAGGPVYHRSWYGNASLSGDGITNNMGQGASGMSSMGGTIRAIDVEKGEINHAIKFTVWADEYFYWKGSNISAYRWPAAACDAYASKSDRYRGSNPNLIMGILLAIKPEVSASSLNFETDFAAVIFEALKKYGGYAVEDAAWDKFYLIGDQSVRSAVQNKYGFDLETKGNNTPWKRDMDKIINLLHIVENNGPNNIGGGPTSDHSNRLAPMACSVGEVGTGNLCPQGPYVELTSPVDSSVINSGSVINLNAYVAKGDVAIDSVLFFLNGNLMGIDVDSSYSLKIPILPDGKYEIYAEAYDSFGSVGISDIHIVWVGNRPPDISIAHPLPDAIYETNFDIQIQATATDANGQVDKVLFYVDSIFVGEKGSPPYNIFYRTERQGEHVCFAIAINNDSDTTYSKPVNFYTINTNSIGEEQVPNSDFETNSLPWKFLWGSENGSFELTDKDGNGKLKIVSNLSDSEKWWGLGIGNAFELYMLEGKTYEFAFDASADSIRDFHFDFKFQDNKILDEGFKLTNREQRFKYPFVAEHTGPVLIQFMPTQSDVPVYLDNVSFIRGALPDISIVCSDTVIVTNIEVITVMANDLDGDVAKVDLYINNELVKSDNQEPFVYNFIADTSMIGLVDIIAVATDNDGLEHSAVKQIYIASMNTTGAGKAPLGSYRVNIFPNPNNGTFFIRNTPEQKLTFVIIYDNAGRVMHKSNISQSKSDHTINLDLDAGIYVIKLFTKEAIMCENIVITK